MENGGRRRVEGNKGDRKELKGDLERFEVKFFFFKRKRAYDL